MVYIFFFGFFIGGFIIGPVPDEGVPGPYVFFFFFDGRVVVGVL